MKSVLIATPKFLPGESAVSIFLRAADLNGWPTVKSMLVNCRPFAPTLTQALRERNRFCKYANLLGIEVPSNHGPYPTMRVNGEKGFRLDSGVGLPEWAFRPWGAAVCPVCLDEDEHPYLRAEWQLKICLTCPDDGCRLLERCERCNEPLNWNRPAPHRCVCGFDLRQATRQWGDRDLAWKMMSILCRRPAEDLSMLVTSYCTYVDALDISDAPELKEQLLQELCAGGDAAFQRLKTSITANTKSIHPRLALLPLLKVRILKGIAERLLQELNEEAIAGGATETLEGEITLSDTTLALGISSPETIMRLCKEGILKICRSNTRPQALLSGITVSRASCDSLLRLLFRRQSEIADSSEMRMPTAPLAEFVIHLVKNPHDSGGYNLNDGLSSLRILSSKKIIPHRKYHDFNIEEYVTFDEAAEIMGVGKYCISSLVSTGWLSMLRDPLFPIRKIISREAVLDFNQRYIFSAVLAKELKMSATGTFIHRLRLRGINPVGGIEIDGTKARFFKRADLDNLNMEEVYSDGLNFRTNGNQRFSNDFISDAEIKGEVVSLIDVMKILGITLPQVRILVNKKFLLRVPAPTLKVMVSKTSVEEYCKVWKDEKLTSIEVAASMVGETKIQFISRWVKSRVVKVKDIGLRKCIRIDRVERIKNIKKHYIFGGDCPKVWFVGRFTLPNFEHRGLITARRIGVGGQLRLYRRSEVELLFGPSRDDVHEL